MIKLQFEDLAMFAMGTDGTRLETPAKDIAKEGGRERKRREREREKVDPSTFSELPSLERASRGKE